VRCELSILYEDNHLLVVDKPAGLATMGTGEANTVHSLACDYLRRKYQKPGNVYLGIVHRLDSMTSGTLVLARTSKAAARLSEQFRRTSESLPGDRPATKKRAAPSPQKSYLAVVQRTQAIARDNDDFRDGIPSEGSLRDWVVKNERDHRMEVTGPATGGAVEALLDFRRTAGDARDLADDIAVVQVQLRTGRKHQIRVQFASRGYPVWGDVKYGGKQQRGTGIALHAWRLSIEHPTAKTEMLFESPVPQSWRRWFPAIRSWPGD
jgi:23S rRNA pseudouridine1911/1915/1917 synthase